MDESSDVGPKTSAHSLTTKQKLPQYFAAIVATLSALSGGCALGWTSPILMRLQGVSGSYTPMDRPLDSDEASWVSSLLTIGAIFGPIFGGILMDRFGRKKTSIALAGVPAVIGWIITLAATNPGMLYAARILIGIATSSALTLGPAYMAEMSSPSERGTLCSLPQLMMTIGVMLEYAAGPYVSYYVLSGINLVFPIAFTVAFLFLHESPYYLLAVDREKEAEEALVWFRGGGVDVSSELYGMSIAVEESGIRDARLYDSFKDLFSTQGNRRAMLVTCGLMFFQQFSGIVAVLFNAEFILTGSSGGKPLMKANEATMVVGGVQIVASWFSTIVVDRAGRKPLLLLSCIFSSLSLFALGTHSYLDYHSRASGLDWLPIASLVVYITAYCLGLGGLPWVVLSEVFPSNCKSAASMLIGSFCWLLAFIVTSTFQPMSSNLGGFATYWFYASFTAAAVAFIFLILPETKCKSLEEIQKELGGL